MSNYYESLHSLRNDIVLKLPLSTAWEGYQTFLQNANLRFHLESARTGLWNDQRPFLCQQAAKIIVSFPYSHARSGGINYIFNRPGTPFQRPVCRASAEHKFTTNFEASKKKPRKFVDGFKNSTLSDRVEFRQDRAPYSLPRFFFEIFVGTQNLISQIVV